jgi:hypothetical protein
VSPFLLVTFILAVVLSGVAIVLRVAQAIQEVERVDRVALNDAERWQLRVAITLMESALSEISFMGRTNRAVTDVEASLMRSISDARRILHERRK